MRIASTPIGDGAPLILIAGPCVIESESHSMRIAESIARITAELKMPFVFKSSYDKANRTSRQGFRGVGIEMGLAILGKVGSTLGIPTLTDVHDVDQVKLAAPVVDCIQIPAFLSRQTDLLTEAGRRARAVNIKKGQFMAPSDISHAIEKVTSTGNQAVMVTERGTSFGYNNLVVDFRGIEIMRTIGKPVVFDATHSVQLPGARGSSSGGQAEHIPALCRAAVAVGVDAVYVEVHDDPEAAPCDGPNALSLDSLHELLVRLLAIDAAVGRRVVDP